jgi:hypothetical protein
VGIPTDANATYERCFLRGPCRDIISGTSLEFRQLVKWSELIGE